MPRSAAHFSSRRIRSPYPQSVSSSRPRASTYPSDASDSFTLFPDVVPN